MSPEIAKEIAALNKEISKIDIMIAYFQDRLKRYKEEKKKLQNDLASMKDDFWEDDG